MYVAVKGGETAIEPQTSKGAMPPCISPNSAGLAAERKSEPCT